VEQFELTSGPFAENPYPIVARLREEAPLFWHEKLNAYVVSRYDDVKMVIEDNTRFHAAPDAKPAKPALAAVDGDQHKRLRRLLTPAFSPRALATSVEPMLAGYAHTLIDKFIELGSVDIVSEFADPMVLLVVSRLLNVSAVDEPWLVAASQEMLEAEADTSNARLTSRYAANAQRLADFFTAVIEQERVSPSGTLMSDMVAAEEQGDRLTHAELLATAEMVVIAGFETTKRLIASLVFALLRNLDQFAALRADPSLLKSAIEETLRFYPPNQIRMRYVGPEIVLHGVTLKPRTKVYALKGGANRDPTVWRDPEVFDITRFTARGLPAHMAFGWGPHHCIGAYLARLETTHAMQALLGRLTDIRLDPEHAVRFVGFRNRGPEALRVRFRALQRPRPTANRSAEQT
jgi:cytochrome P450